MCNSSVRTVAGGKPSWICLDFLLILLLFYIAGPRFIILLLGTILGPFIQMFGSVVEVVEVLVV